MDKRLVLVSPYDPAAGFNIGHAMQRNKLIYALADAALVVSADFQKGGTWEGAIEQIERWQFVTVFVRSGEHGGMGNRALIQRGGRPWPEPRNSDELVQAIKKAAAAAAAEPKQETLSFALREQPAPSSSLNSAGTAALTPVAEPLSAKTEKPATRLLACVRELLVEELGEGRPGDEIAELLGVSRPQALAWLLQLVREGTLEKFSKPARFRAAKPSDRLL